MGIFSLRRKLYSDKKKESDGKLSTGILIGAGATGAGALGLEIHSKKLVDKARELNPPLMTSKTPFFGDIVIGGKPGMTYEEAEKVIKEHNKLVEKANRRSKIAMGGYLGAAGLGIAGLGMKYREADYSKKDDEELKERLELEKRDKKNRLACIGVSLASFGGVAANHLVGKGDPKVNAAIYGASLLPLGYGLKKQLDWEKDVQAFEKKYDTKYGHGKGLFRVKPLWDLGKGKK